MTVALLHRASQAEGTLHDDGDMLVELVKVPAGARQFDLTRDELWHFTAGRATFTAVSGEVIAVVRETVVHFKQGWRGRAEVEEPLQASRVACAGGPGATTPVLRNVTQAPALKDWGPTGTSHTSGILLSREPDGRAESGVWICTPGRWDCHVTRDEFCHFLSGRCTYIHQSGEEIAIEPDTAAFFPKDWRGVCTVHETVRKVYFIR